MAKVSVNVKMEEKVRDEAKKVFHELGLDMTTAVNLFLLTAIREKSIPFYISMANQEVEQQKLIEEITLNLKKSEEEITANKGISLDSALNELKEKYGLTNL